MALKVDFHVHTGDDAENRITYSTKDIIDIAESKGYDALCITNHDLITYDSTLKEYAAKRGILLIPGLEINIENKHILLINVKDCNNIKTLSDIEKLKSNKNLIIAPHPFFPGMQALGKTMYEIPHLFDAVEFCHFYSPNFNFNNEGIRFSKKYHLPMVSNSDAHLLEQFGNAYTLVETEDKDILSIIKAVKEGKVSFVAPPLTISRMILIYLKILLRKKTIFDLCTRVFGIASKIVNIKEMKKNIK